MSVIDYLFESKYPGGTYSSLLVSDESQKELFAFCAGLGIDNLVDPADYHCTVIYSKVPCFDIADEDFYEATWLAEGMPWIDPKKEAEADNIALQNNTTTLQAVCARNGLDWLDVLDQKEREQKEITKRGLTPTLVINQTTQKGEGDDTNAE